MSQKRYEPKASRSDEREESSDESDVSGIAEMLWN